MKLSVASRNVRITGALATREFSIKAGPYIMSILSGLYQNPHDAAVREYITNCHDAAVALLASDPKATIKPPTVIVPGSLSSELVFADHGIGMSHDTVWNVFSEYGNSTKNDSNDQTGGFGIGAKVWAAIADGSMPITIESRFNGEKNVFMAFISEASVPTLAHVSTEKTTEHNGTIIKLPIGRDHYETIRTAMRRYVPYYPSPIVVEGMEPIAPVSYLIKSPTNLWGIRTYVPNEHDGLRIVVGGVPYDYSRYQLPTLEHPIPQFLVDNNVDLYLPVGSVNIVPSRESLMYTDKTKTAINHIVKKMVDEIRVEVNGKLAAAKTEWEALKTLYVMDNIRHLTDMMGDYATWNDKALNPVAGVVRTYESLQTLDPTVEASLWGLADSYRAKIELLWEGTLSASDKRMRVKPNDHTYVVFNDMEGTKSERLVKAMLRSKLVVIDSYSKRAQKGGHKHGQAVLLKTALSKEQIATFFGGMPVENIIYASSLKEVYQKERAQREAKKYKDTIYRFYNTKRGYETVGSWEAGVVVPSTVDENGDPDETIRYYLPLAQHGRKRYKYTPYFDVSALVNHAERFGLLSSCDTVYGIKAEDINKFDDEVWVNLYDAVEVKAMKIATDELEALVAYVRRNDQNVNEKLLTLVKEIGLDTEKTKSIKEYLKAVKSLGDKEVSDMVDALYLYVYNQSPVSAATKDIIQKMVAKVAPVDINTLENQIRTEYPIIVILEDFFDGYRIEEAAKKHKARLFKLMTVTP